MTNKNQIKHLIKKTFTLLLLLLTFYGCRKSDSILTDTPQNYEQLKSKFFNTSSVNDNEIKNLAEDIKKQDSIFNFLPDFVKKNGIPKWDKVIYKTSTGKNVNTRQSLVTTNSTSSQSSVVTNTNNGNSQGIFFIPLQSQNSKEIKSYITAYKHNDSVYTYRLYNKDSLNAVQTGSSITSNNLLTTQAVFGVFEKSINNIDSVNIKSPRNGTIRNAKINFNPSTEPNSINKSNTNSNTTFSGGCSIKMFIQVEYSVDFLTDGNNFYYSESLSVTVAIIIDCSGGAGGGSGGAGCGCPSTNPGGNPSTNPGGNPAPSPGGNPTTNPGVPNPGNFWWGYGTGWPWYSGGGNAYIDPSNWGWWWTTGGGGGGSSMILTPLESFLSSLSSNQSSYWNDPINNQFISLLSNYLSTNNYSNDAKNHVISLIDLLIDDPTLSTEELENYFLNESQEEDGVYDASFWDNQSPNSTKDNLPSLISFYNAFPKRVINGFVYKMESKDVFSEVGGNMDLKNKAGDPNYQNACAVRGSRALNYANKEIPDGTHGTEKGADGKNYILSAKAFNKYMNITFGSPGPTNRITKADINGDPKKISDFLKGKNGIYTMVISGKSYTGHIDLIINGRVVGGTAIGTDISKVDYIEIWPLN